MHFEPVRKADFPTEEQRVLAFWREQDIFAKTMAARSGGPEFVFYDGPPFATGLPHYGHLLAGAIKDVIPRYQTMQGKFVDRVFGWDCHGLPVENEMEKELQINSKHEIESYGVDRFNEACRGIVLKYTSEWEQVVERMGRWVDFDRGYRTMDLSYMESIWWVFKQLWDKDLIYEGDKIMWYCPRCATPLSNFEVNQGYRDTKDPAITVRFKLNGSGNRYIIAWTTTPWTLPANFALAVGEDIDYVEVEDGDDTLILAEARMGAYYPKEQPTVIRTFKGAELVGTSYAPILPFFPQHREDAYRVIAADFVTTGDGAGVVHIAPGFGEDDNRVGKENGLPVHCPLDDEGRYTAVVHDFAGRFVKDCDADIIQRLREEGSLVRKTTVSHSYPHCWRCEAPLLNRSIPTWFVRVEKIKDRMVAANQQIQWVPGHLKDGRFGKWLENARDWAISRNRYWGCPLPIWHDRESGQIEVFGSVAELEARSGQTITDIHKHFVDPIELPGTDGVTLRRVPQVLDCWFESGSMPYAQKHYPFENEGWVEDHLPADFIAEGLDQTRGWFYTLVVLGAALFDRPPFRNVIVNGLILAEDGAKMSKRLRNYPDPMEIMNKYGADAMRLYLLSSQVVRGENLRFSEKRHMVTDQATGKEIQTPDGVQETMRAVLLPLWNSYSFFITYANVDGWDPRSALDVANSAPKADLDRWILARLNSMVTQVTDRLDAYDLQGAGLSFSGFVGDLTNWYIRRSRRRFWKSQDDSDKHEAYSTLYHVLVTFCQAAAPLTPFMTETIYRNLRRPFMTAGESDAESVHLCDFPKPNPALADETLERRMGRAITAVSLGRFLRTQATIKVRQPLAESVLLSLDPETRADLEAIRPLVAEELNVKSVRVDANEATLVDLSAKANFKRLGKRLQKRMKHAAGAIAGLDDTALTQLQLGETLTIELADGGDAVEITIEDVEIRRTEREGIAVANEGDITVALDLQLDDGLVREGLAREIVNRLQGMRKDAGLQVDDRIVVCYEAPAAISTAIEQYGTYISDEVLATSLRSEPTSGVDIVDINGHACTFAIVKEAG